MKPTTLAELSECVRASDSLRIIGRGTKTSWCGSAAGTPLSLREFSGIIEYSPSDQVVVVRAGTGIQELNAELQSHGQCVPVSDGRGTVGGALSMNLPHRMEGEHGSWRDWVLGMTVVQADGTVAKAGSRAVKNVAGYDVHKFLVGTRGIFAVAAEIILRTTPFHAVAWQEETWPFAAQGTGAFQRVLRTNYEAATVANAGNGFDMPSSQTLYREGISWTRFPDDWLLRQGEPLPGNRFTTRAKALFDPSNKLNPGELLP